MLHVAYIKWKSDHCRIGSLENILFQIGAISTDHCRIGSLENTPLGMWFSIA